MLRTGFTNVFHNGQHRYSSGIIHATAAEAENARRRNKHHKGKFLYVAQMVWEEPDDLDLGSTSSPDTSKQPLPDPSQHPEA
ncbi:MAG: hypothetical protein JWR89_5234 [Tardiphaga sp.]|jgi:hypothetical protein|nr:hypothetical protein [Tardiphaga sp.]